MLPPELSIEVMKAMNDRDLLLTRLLLGLEIEQEIVRSPLTEGLEIENQSPFNDIYGPDSGSIITAISDQGDHYSITRLQYTKMVFLPADKIIHNPFTDADLEYVRNRAFLEKGDWQLGRQILGSKVNIFTYHQGFRHGPEYWIINDQIRLHRWWRNGSRYPNFYWYSETYVDREYWDLSGRIENYDLYFIYLTNQHQKFSEITLFGKVPLSRIKGKRTMRTKTLIDLY